MEDHEIFVVVIVTRTINQDQEPCDPERAMFVEKIDASEYSKWFFWAMNQMVEDYGETEHFELHYIGKCDSIHTMGNSRLGPPMHWN